jgi:peptide/nickel transport system substrate-binding protein
LQELLRQNKISRREFMRRAMILGMSLGGAQAFLSACTGLPAPQPAPAGGEAPAAQEEPAAAPAAEEAAEPTQGGHVTWALDSDPVNLIPFGAVNTSNQHGKEFMYDSLLEWDKDLIVQPALAESWETPDDKTWVFKLRQGVKFHNGKEVTAEDVIYSMALQKEPPEPGQIHSFYPAIESVEAVDNYTVKFNMTGPDPTVEGYLSWGRYSAIIPKDAYDQWNLVTEGVGTGPFKLIEYIPNDRVEYERNTDFWKPGLPYLDRLTLKVLPDESGRVAALRSGEIQGCTVSADTARTLASDPNIVILSGLFSAPRVLQFTIKGDDKPWNDVRVRQAISKAIDREQIIANVFGGEAEYSAPIPPGYGDWFIPPDELKENWHKHDLELAKQLMAEAGFEGGFDITLYAIANHDASQTAEVVQQQLKAININVEVISEEIGPFAQRVGDGTFDWCSTGRGMRPDPTRYVNDFGNPFGDDPAGRWFNKGEGWSNQELVDLYNKALVELDSEARHQQIRRIQELVLEEVPHVYVCQPMKFHAVRSNLKDMYVAFNDFHTGLRTVWLADV